MAIRCHNQWKTVESDLYLANQATHPQHPTTTLVQVQDLKLVLKGHSALAIIPVPQNSMRFLQLVGFRYHICCFWFLDISRGCQSFSLSVFPQRPGSADCPRCVFNGDFVDRGRRVRWVCRRRESSKINFKMILFATSRLLNHVESCWIMLNHVESCWSSIYHVSKCPDCP